MKKSLTILFLVTFSFAVAQQKAPAAKDILAVAYKKAVAEHKNILLIFHASWCGWCHKMDSSINNSSCKKLLDDNYVITHLVAHESTDKKNEENEGVDQLLKQYKAFDSGIPFWVVLDKEGNLLKDSFLKNTDGTSSIIGCPASDMEVAAFVKILKETSSLTGRDLEIIATVFRRNEAR